MASQTNKTQCEFGEDCAYPDLADCSERGHKKATSHLNNEACSKCGVRKAIVCQSNPTYCIPSRDHDHVGPFSDRCNTCRVNNGMSLESSTNKIKPFYGTCVDCPETERGTKQPQNCMNKNRYDHRLT